MCFEFLFIEEINVDTTPDHKEAQESKLNEQKSFCFTAALRFLTLQKSVLV